MGMLSISLPAADLAAMQARAVTFGLTMTKPMIIDGVANVGVIGDGEKCIRATALSTVKRLRWNEKAPVTTEDRKSSGVKPVTFKER